MINYCIDYIYQDGDYVDYGTIIEDSEESRDNLVDSWSKGRHYTITSVYENEDCYCQARSYGECACGNFK